MKADSYGKASFSFTNIPAGEYLIAAFVDANSNGKLDCSGWGFAEEPTFYYNPLLIPCIGNNRYDQKFKVVRNVNGIRLK